MTNKKKLSEELRSFDTISQKDESLIDKLNEFIELLDTSEIDSKNVKELKSRINHALDRKIEGVDLINEVRGVATADLDKIKQLEQLEILLTNNHFDSGDAKKLSYKQGIVKAVKILIGVLFITLGFAMIIMPAPQYFEMFTIFYFNPNDGVTLMDLISLIIIAVGIYIIINSSLNIKINE